MKRVSTLVRDTRGVTVVEFAFLAPVMILLICGTVEAGYMYMVQSTLEGSVTNAARRTAVNLDLTEDQRDQAMRAEITRVMQEYAPETGMSLTLQTTPYRSFGSVTPEPYEDLNGNGNYDGPSSPNPEPFTDRNRNGTRDMAVPIAGRLGGVGDVVAYTAAFPAKLLFGFLRPIFGDRHDITVSVYVRNEPTARRLAAQ